MILVYKICLIMAHTGDPSCLEASEGMEFYNMSEQIHRLTLDLREAGWCLERQRERQRHVRNSGRPDLGSPHLEPCNVAHTFHLCTQEEEAGGSPEGQSQPELKQQAKQGWKDGSVVKRTAWS